MRYTNDSTAEDLYRYSYAEPGDAVRRNTKEKEQREEQKKTALYEITVKRQNKKVKQSLVAAIAVVFVLASVLLCRYASIYEMHYRTARIDSQIEALNIENNRLEAMISSNSNVVDIDSVAQNELGMQKPQPYQVVSINVEPVDELKMNNNLQLDNASDDLTWYEEIIKGVKDFFGFVDY
ncbi:MAG: hypothetical protein E7384_04855 [Ruminococcaceae bacterium]|nr:hypothetical protein [Oscillospiraceae bacterium]